MVLTPPACRCSFALPRHVLVKYEPLGNCSGSVVKSVPSPGGLHDRSPRHSLAVPETRKCVGIVRGSTGDYSNLELYPRIYHPGPDMTLRSCLRRNQIWVLMRSLMAGMCEITPISAPSCCADLPAFRVPSWLHGGNRSVASRTGKPTIRQLGESDTRIGCFRCITLMASQAAIGCGVPRQATGQAIQQIPVSINRPGASALCRKVCNWRSSL